MAFGLVPAPGGAFPTCLAGPVLAIFAARRGGFPRATGITVPGRLRLPQLSFSVPPFLADEIFLDVDAQNVDG